MYVKEKCPYKNIMFCVHKGNVSGVMYQEGEGGMEKSV